MDLKALKVSAQKALTEDGNWSQFREDANPQTILDLIGRVEAGESFIAEFRQADLHCDVLGYIAGDYNDDPVDGEGIAMADELRKLLSQKG